MLERQPVTQTPLALTHCRSAVLIMLHNFSFLLKAQTGVDTAHHELHRWPSTVSTAPTEELI